MATMLDAVINLKDNFSDTLQKVESQVKDFQRTSEATAKDVWRTGKSIEGFGKSMMKNVTAPIVGLGTLAVRETIKTEKAVSGMAKTLDGTPKEIQAIKKELDELATTELPVDRVDLFGLAETAGQLGVAKENVVEFTKVTAQLGEATNLVGQDGAANLAKFTNIMGTANNDMDKLGSTIMDLDANTATTAKDIVDMGMRIAAAGKQANMTESDVLGISAALSSLGLESQAGGSAFSKVILEMNDSVMTGKGHLEGFAKVAGMTAKEFQTAWKDDATGATIEFVKGLGKIQEEGGNVAGVIEDLGFKEVRTRDALLRLAGASDLFTDTLERSKKAWSENLALQEVFDIMTDNTASKLQIMKNQLSVLGDEIGTIVIPVVHQLIDYVSIVTDWFGNLSDEQKESIVKFAAFAAAIGPVIFILGRMTTGVGKAIFKFADFAKGLKKYGSILGMLKSPSAIVVGTLLTLAAAAVIVYKNWGKIKEVVQLVKEKFMEFTGVTGEHIEWFKEIIINLAKTVWEKFQEVWQSLEPLKEKFGELFSSLGDLFELIMPFLMPILAFITGVFVAKIIHGFLTLFHQVSAVVEGIIGVIEGIITFLQGLIDFIIGVFTGDWGRAWEGIQTMFTGVVDIITSAWQAFVDFVTAPVEALVDILDSAFHEKAEKVKKVWGEIKEFLKHPIKGTVNLARKGAGWAAGKLGIGQNYKGTMSWRGGPTWVHERGGEIIDLPRGTRIYPHDKSIQMARAEGEQRSSKSISIAKLADTIVVREDADIDKIAKALVRELEKAELNMA